MFLVCYQNAIWVYLSQKDAEAKERAIAHDLYIAYVQAAFGTKVDYLLFDGFQIDHDDLQFLDPDTPCTLVQGRHSRLVSASFARKVLPYLQRDKFPSLRTMNEWFFDVALGNTIRIVEL